MSDVVESGAGRLPAEWDRLELAARRLLGEHDRLRRHADQSSRRIRELEEALAGVSAGTLDPVALTDRLERLEAENRDLRTRLETARERVEALLGRLRFLEEAR
jgi:predicted RNase H-like nuclease (RuvC/YqgF family)